MKRTKKFVVAGVATVLLASGVGTPAHAAAADVKPMGSNVCAWFPWLWFCP